MTPPPSASHRTSLRLASLVAAAVFPTAAFAATVAFSYDRPLAEIHVNPVTFPGHKNISGELVCHNYPGFMLKEFQSDDQNASNPLFVTDSPAGAAKPLGRPQIQPREITIPDEGYRFEGVRGRFIELASPSAAQPGAFAIYDRSSGRLRYRDSRGDRGIEAMQDKAGILYLTFQRALYLDCSIPKDGVSCWERSALKAKLSHAVSSQPTPTPACAIAYGKTMANVADVSIVSYEVNMRVDAAGQVVVLSRGSLECASKSITLSRFQMNRSDPRNNNYVKWEIKNKR